MNVDFELRFMEAMPSSVSTPDLANMVCDHRRDQGEPGDFPRFILRELADKDESAIYEMDIFARGYTEKEAEQNFISDLALYDDLIGNADAVYLYYTPQAGTGRHFPDTLYYWVHAKFMIYAPGLWARMTDARKARPKKAVLL